MSEKTKASSLVPKIEQYLENDLNVLLVGYHGVGKTYTVQDVADKAGVKLKYYSCATLDPYTDLVGIPVPRENGEGIETLKMIRPREIDEAELIFFDELNRADPKVLNAVLEIVQFGSINGEKLPNLRACWGAINPPGEVYNVDELDPALVDRFDIYIELKGKPNVKWMTENGLPQPIAAALVQFWVEHNNQKRGPEHMISPRKLFTIGKVFMITNSIDNAIPQWINAERNKLRDMLKRAKEDYDKSLGKHEYQKVKLDETGRTMGNGAHTGITYEANWLRDNRSTVSEFLKNNPEDLDTHNAIMKTLESCHAHRLMRDHAEILNEIKPVILEGFVSTLNNNRHNLMRESLNRELGADRLAQVPNLRKALTEG